MTNEGKRTIALHVDAETGLRLESAANKRGISVEQYCSDAIFRELNGESPPQKFSAKGMIAAGEAVFRGRLSVTDSAVLMREAREERHRDT